MAVINLQRQSKQTSAAKFDQTQASERPTAWRLLWRLATLLGGVFAFEHAQATDVPEDSAEAMYHYYDGGGVIASGPALLVRKKVNDTLSLSAGYYVDSVSNASIDVVTTASKFKEVRQEYSFGTDYVYRDSKLSFSAATSREPDYTANSFGLDIAQETFGGMTTVNVGFTRGEDKVLKHKDPTFSDYAQHWMYRFGVAQILTPHWIMSVNGEIVADDGYLSSPYRVARVFGAAVPENDPRTRSSRAVDFKVIGDLGSRDAVHAEYRYFWDNWAIKANTMEFGYSRYFGENWLADTSVRYYRQTKALFYSDNAQSDTLYISRNRQLSQFHDADLGGRVTYSLGKVSGDLDVKLNASVHYTKFNFDDFTDIRTGKLYTYGASSVQLYASATF